MLAAEHEVIDKVAMKLIWMCWLIHSALCQAVSSLVQTEHYKRIMYDPSLPPLTACMSCSGLKHFLHICA